MANVTTCHSCGARFNTEGMKPGTKLNCRRCNTPLVVGQAPDLLNEVIEKGVRLRASDIHIEPMEESIRVRYRVDGVLIPGKEFPHDVGGKMISRIKLMAEADITEKRRHQDGRFSLQAYGHEIDIRMSTYITVHGENVVLRILNKQVGLVPIEKLGMPEAMRQDYIDFVLGAPAGVVIITGPTGSGKTTTLYSSIAYCNDDQVKIITAEDPVEYTIDGIMQCSINPGIGLTYEDTLKAIVRQDPDIIVLGEIRDASSAQTAIQAALTGHKVFTTFHTEDAVGAILRLTDMEIETFLIASTVTCVVAQRLVRTICPKCATQTRPHRREIYLMGLDPKDMEGRLLRRGKGCKNCHHTGYRGRAPIFEILILSNQVKDAVLERKPSHVIRELSIETAGMVTLMEYGIALALQGRTTFEEVLSAAPRTRKPRDVATIHRILGIKEEDDPGATRVEE